MPIEEEDFDSFLLDSVSASSSLSSLGVGVKEQVRTGVDKMGLLAPTNDNDNDNNNEGYEPDDFEGDGAERQEDEGEGRDVQSLTAEDSDDGEDGVETSTSPEFKDHLLGMWLGEVSLSLSLLWVRVRGILIYTGVLVVSVSYGVLH